MKRIWDIEMICLEMLISGVHTEPNGHNKHLLLVRVQVGLYDCLPVAGL